MEILVNSREMALELSYVYIKYVYGKEKAEFQKPYSITDDNNCWKIEGKQPKTLVRIPLYSITDWHRSPISDSHPFDQPGT